MPCLLWLKDGSVLAVLERVDEAQVRAVLPLVMDRPGRLQLSDLLAQVRGGAGSSGAGPGTPAGERARARWAAGNGLARRGGPSGVRCR
jgi:hypothetical protein